MSAHLRIDPTTWVSSPPCPRDRRGRPDAAPPRRAAPFSVFQGPFSRTWPLAGRPRQRLPFPHSATFRGGAVAHIATLRRAPDVHRYLLAGGSASIVTLARGRSARTAAACQEGTISRGARRDGPPRDGSPRDGSPRDGRGGAPRSTRRTRKRQGFRSGGPYHKAPPPTILPDPQAF